MKYAHLLEKAFNAILAICLSCMGIFIFMNVVLRYAFNSGLTWAEELSRFLFVWLVFLGAIGAMKDNTHLGFTSLVQKLPPTAKKMAYFISNGIVLYCLVALLQGSYEMTLMTTRTNMPATDIPLACTYGVGIIMSLGMLVIVLINLYRALFVKGAIDKLIVLRESEEERNISVGGQTGGNTP